MSASTLGSSSWTFPSAGPFMPANGCCTQCLGVSMQKQCFWKAREPGEEWRRETPRPVLITGSGEQLPRTSVPLQPVVAVWQSPCQVLLDPVLLGLPIFFFFFKAKI